MNNNELLDRILIRERMDAYLMSVDSHETKAFADNFTDDGIYESPFGTSRGRKEIEAAIEQWHGSGGTTGKRHMSGPLVIHSLSGDTAKASATYWVMEARDTPAIIASGAYTDVLRKVNGQWLLAERRQTVDPSYKFPGQ